MKQNISKRSKILLSVLAVLVIAFFVVILSLDTLIKSGINTYAPKITQTDTGVSGIGINVFNGSVSVDGLFVDNPKGYSDKTLLKVNKAYVDVDLSSLTSNLIIVEEITIDGVDFLYETKGLSSNISALLDNLKGQEKGNKSAKADTTASSSSSVNEKKVYIKQVTLTNCKVEVAAGGLKLVAIPLPNIILTDIGKPDGGVSFIEASVQVLGSVLEKILVVVAQQSAQGAGVLSDTVKSGIDSIKSIFK